MPWTEAQIRLFRSDLGKLRKGRKTRTGMSREQLLKAASEGVKPGTVKGSYRRMLSGFRK